MVQIIAENRRPTMGERLSQGVGRGLEMGSQMLQEHEQAQMRQQRAKTIENLTGMDTSGMTEKQQEIFLSKILEQQGKSQRLGQTQDFLSQIFGGRQQQQQQNVPQQFGEMAAAEQQAPQGFDPSQLSDSDIAQADVLQPGLGRLLQQQKDVVLREKRESGKREEDKFQSERTYHTQFSKKAEEEVENIRSNLSKKEFSLDLSRNAVESGEVGALSLANLAQRLNIPEWQTMKGAQLETAIKENLLSNMSRVSAKGQNIWFEKRLNSMMAQIGKSEEANLAAQEILEGEVAMDRAYIDNFDRLSEQDLKEHKFVKKDISKRARDASKYAEKEIMKRTSYRLKELEEQERGAPKLKKEVGKNVIKGTPLTLQMAKLYKDKFGENALDVAEKNGYYIPTLEEFRIFQQRPQEYREGIVQ